MFRRAERKQARLRLAIAGPSGSGKTYSSLLIAKGLGGSIAMIDTERKSGELYCDLCQYDVAQLSPPYSPEKYIAAIRCAEDNGYNVLIIDSLSHAWAGAGGVLDIKERIAKSSKGMNDFTAWREATPLHNSLVDTILDSRCHIIATLRTKTSYEVVQGENGKAKVMKLGLAFIQREGLEYEFTAVLDLSVDGHVATSSKDRTGLFDGRYIIPSEETGVQLLEWLSSGKAEESSAAGQPQNGNGQHSFIEEIRKMLDQLGLVDFEEAYHRYAANRYGTAAIEELLPDQRVEALALLKQCSRNDKRKQLVGVLKQHQLAA